MLKALDTFSEQLRLINRKLCQIIELLELLTKMLAEQQDDGEGATGTE